MTDDPPRPRRVAGERVTAAPGTAPRADRHELARKQARVQRELAFVQGRWERSLNVRPDASTVVRAS